MNRLAVYQLKGGVGKTTTAVNLAWMAARDGWQTLLWDLDPQGAATYVLRGESAKLSPKKLLRGTLPVGRAVRQTAWEGLDLLPANINLRDFDTQIHKEEAGRGWLADTVARFGEEYRLVVLDCPPSLSHLAENVLSAADLVLMPTVPSPLAVRAYSQVREHVEAKGGKHPPVLRPFINFADRRRAAHLEILASPGRFLPGASRVVIPASAMIERMSTVRAPLPTYAPPSHVAVQAYEALWRDTKRQLQKLGKG
jgi:chromosome partitioning protein